ncbi:MAG: ribonuclease HII [Anaerolineales bacterium]|nr:ribonuclease HII [Anaerolineales bacterium]
MSKARPRLAQERRWWRQGYQRVAGLDEVGRGAWAGPVVAAAVILPPDQPGLSAALRGVTDSKQLTARQRERLAEVIGQVALAIGVGGAGAGEVDRDGLIGATRAAMQRAIGMLALAPEALLIDALDLTPVAPLPQQAVIFGESVSLSIAAASIIAKVSRDRWMAGLDARYPGYGFGRHKGYGTRGHSAALAQLGVSDVHRRSYAPIARLCSEGRLARPK